MTRASFAISCCALLVLLGGARTACAHVSIVTPAAGSSVPMGQPVTITWIDLILHEGIGYDIDFIPYGDPDGQDGVIPVAHGLPVTAHTFQWLTPNTPCDGCYLKVTQVNRGTNYLDEISVSLVAAAATTPPPDSAGGANGVGGAPVAAGGSSSNSGGAAGSSASSEHHYGTSSGGAPSNAMGGAPSDGDSEAGRSASAGSATAAPGAGGSSDPSSAGDAPSDGTTPDGAAGSTESAASLTIAGGCSLGRHASSAWLAPLTCLGLMGLARRRTRRASVRRLLR